MDSLSICIYSIYINRNFCGMKSKSFFVCPVLKDSGSFDHFCAKGFWAKAKSVHAKMS